MKVVLLDNIRGLGKMGDVKNVADGYAQNYLIPRKLAQPAHGYLVNQIEDLKKKAGFLAQEELENAKEIVKLVSDPDFVLEIQRKANKEGRLYAAINEKGVTEALKNKGLKVSPENVKIKEPIKSVGDHEIELDFGSDVKTKARLHVQP